MYCKMSSISSSGLGWRALVQFGTAHPTLFAHLSQREVRGDWLDSAALEIVESAVEDLTQLGDLVQVADQRVFDQVVRVATSFLSKPVEFGLLCGVRLTCTSSVMKPSGEWRQLRERARAAKTTWFETQQSGRIQLLGVATETCRAPSMRTRDGTTSDPNEVTASFHGWSSLNGSMSRRPAKRRKPRSCEASTRPCSMARAAISMSGTSSLLRPGVCASSVAIA